MTNHRSRLLAACLTALCLSTGCATSFRPVAPTEGLTAFTFTLTPEQCERLKRERRNYRASENASVYVTGASTLVTTIFLAVPALRDERAVQGASAGVSLLAGATGAFTSSQVNDLDQELADGGCSR